MSLTSFQVCGFSFFFFFLVSWQLAFFCKCLFIHLIFQYNIIFHIAYLSHPFQLEKSCDRVWGISRQAVEISIWRGRMTACDWCLMGDSKNDYTWSLLRLPLAYDMGSESASRSRTESFHSFRMWQDHLCNCPVANGQLDSLHSPQYSSDSWKTLKWGSLSFVISCEPSAPG